MKATVLISLLAIAAISDRCCIRLACAEDPGFQILWRGEGGQLLKSRVVNSGHFVDIELRTEGLDRSTAETLLNTVTPQVIAKVRENPALRGKTLNKIPRGNSDRREGGTLVRTVRLVIADAAKSPEDGGGQQDGAATFAPPARRPPTVAARPAAQDSPFESNIGRSMRTWTDGSGKFSIEADFVKMTGENVVLRKADGTTLDVPMARLSQRDQEVVKQLDTREVVADGSGQTVDEARIDAFRHAVQSVMATMVDSKTLERNDKLIFDQVLVYCEGFVVGYEEVSPPVSKGGLIRVRIRARVRRREVLEKVSSVTSQSDATGLFAEAVTKLDRLQGGMLMLKKELESYPICVLAKRGSFREVSQNPDDRTAKVAYEAEIWVDEQKYERLQKRLVEILEPVATIRGDLQTDSKPLPDERNSHEKFRNRFLSQWGSEKVPRVFFPQIEYAQQIRYEGILPEEWEKTILDGPVTRFAINSDPGTPQSRASWRCLEVNGSPELPSGGLTVTIGFYDGKGSAVYQATVPIGPAMPGVSVTSLGSSQRAVVLSPFFVYSVNAGRNSYMWFARTLRIEGKVKLTLDQLRQIKTFDVKMFRGTTSG